MKVSCSKFYLREKKRSKKNVEKANNKKRKLIKGEFIAKRVKVSKSKIHFAMITFLVF